jgi:SAM-dependent methyltransferase
MDIAASIQSVTEETILRIARELHGRTGMKNLALAGGVALNCVANGRLLREGPFESIWIQPAAGDAGGALGAALFVWYQLLERSRHADGIDQQKGSLLGPQFRAGEIQEFLDAVGANYRRYDNEAELLEYTAQALVDEKVVGWFDGRMEFGPRALGARSLLGDPRSAKMQATMNLKIKFRESFRPFAPAILREHVHEWFAMRPNEDSPYMLLIAPVLEKRRVSLSREDSENLRNNPDLLRRVNMVRSSIPAVTHVDYSARVQTIDERHGRFQRLMRTFCGKSACPVLVNTSFNLSWEPIVATPQDAYHTFMQSEIDVLVLGDFVLQKTEQPLGLHPWTTFTGSGERDPASPWADPVTGEPLVVTETCAYNPSTRTCYPVTDGIPRLFVPTMSTDAGADVTELVKQFYEKTPFPNYDDLDNQRALLEKARAGTFARLLNEQIPYSARVLDVGCGTGQLTNFLAIAHRSVLGIDVCLNSLSIAQKFKIENGLERATFAQMNLFSPTLKRDYFDVVISNGVLHHTNDCKSAFLTISKLVKPGGHLVVGLYSAYSRKLHYLRKAIFRWTGLTGKWLDPHFGRTGAIGKCEAWFQDQYRHPHETCHTLDEVLGWMHESNLEFINSIPKPVIGPALAQDEQLFAPKDPGSAISRFLSQVANLSSGYREGGFFIVIGRRTSGEGK